MSQSQRGFQRHFIRSSTHTPARPHERKEATPTPSWRQGIIAELVRVEKKGGGISAGGMVAMVFLLLGAGTEMTTRLIQWHYLAINHLKMGGT